jgi:hypothetical protein
LSSIVVDASVTLAWCFTDEQTPLADLPLNNRERKFEPERVAPHSDHAKAVSGEFLPPYIKGLESGIELRYRRALGKPFGQAALSRNLLSRCQETVNLITACAVHSSRFPTSGKRNKGPSRD